MILAPPGPQGLVQTARFTKSPLHHMQEKNKYACMVIMSKKLTGLRDDPETKINTQADRWTSHIPWYLLTKGLGLCQPVNKEWTFRNYSYWLALLYLLGGLKHTLDNSSYRCFLYYIKTDSTAYIVLMHIVSFFQKDVYQMNVLKIIHNHLAHLIISVAS